MTRPIDTVAEILSDRLGVDVRGEALRSREETTEWTYQYAIIPKRDGYAGLGKGEVLSVENKTGLRVVKFESFDFESTVKVWFE